MILVSMNSMKVRCNNLSHINCHSCQLILLIIFLVTSQDYHNSDDNNSPNDIDISVNELNEGMV